MVRPLQSCRVPCTCPSASLDSESSQSSSGYEDGLGRRVLAFDRETGEMLERLVLRPELSAFEDGAHASESPSWPNSRTSDSRGRAESSATRTTA